MQLKPLKNTAEVEASICLLQTGGPSMLGTSVRKNQSLFLLQQE
jgi:hypothetical protein